MILKNNIEIVNTQEKLACLETHFEALNNATADDEHVRELTRRSLKKYINQFKEELVRSHAGLPARRTRRVLNDAGLVQTRRKLADLERSCEAHKHEACGDQKASEMSLPSLKRMINQLKEEIIWTEVHQPSHRDAAQS